MSEKYSIRKVRSSSITTVISLSLVIFMLGLLGLVILNAQKLAQNVKENIGIQIIIKENVEDNETSNLINKMEKATYTRSSVFVSKEEAAKKLQEDLGEDFISFIGYNPLLSSINIKLKAEYANNDSINSIKLKLMENNTIKEIVYQKVLIDTINENVNKISIVILIFSALLMLIALALINNTIRLSIYSKRFIIKTMQLVGATQGFIRRPFVIKGIKHGIYAAFTATLMLVGVLYFAFYQLPELKELQDEKMLLTLFGIVFLLGIIISWISTSLAVRKYLRLKTDDLYY